MLSCHGDSQCQGDVVGTVMLCVVSVINIIIDDMQQNLFRLTTRNLSVEYMSSCCAVGGRPPNVYLYCNILCAVCTLVLWRVLFVHWYSSFSHINIRLSAFLAI